MKTLFTSPTAEAPVSAGADLIKDGNDRTFVQDVMEASRTVPVIVDFWAPWCGPCKQLGPMLEKLVRGARGAVKLVKIDIDRNQAIAAQLRVQSIPAVYAFFQGRPVDYFMGAVSEGQLKQFIDQLVRLGGTDPGSDVLEQALEQAARALEGGNTAAASNIYGQILRSEPENAAAYTGLIRCHLANRDVRKARQMVDRAPAAVAGAKEMAAVRTALDLADEGQQVGSVGKLREALARNADDHPARFDLAMALYAAGDREGAVTELIEIVRRDRGWEDDKARKQLLKLFEAFGPTDRATVTGRRRLSSILFS